MIDLVQDIKPVSYVKAHTAEVLEQLQVKNSPVIITQNGEAKAVLMDVHQYQDIINAMNLLRIVAIGENDIRQGRTYTHDEVKNKIRAILD
jgi:prevent-host-death family protein